MYRIFSVGYLFPGGGVEVVPFESKQSLLDADVIVFEPTLGCVWSSDTYQGKPLLSEDYSFKMKERLAHWRRELKDAFEAGKVIFVFLSRPREVFVDTGRREYSATGRNRNTTKIVELTSSYETLPLTLHIHARTGKKIIASGDLGFLTSYWSEFGVTSSYEVTIEGKFTRVLLRARTGTATVGAAVLGTSGAIILLPPPGYDEDEFTAVDPDTKEEAWNEAAERFGSRLAAALANVATAIKSATAESPPPPWLSEDRYRLPLEKVLQKAIRECTAKLETIQSERADLEKQLKDAGRLRRLLYERGHPLEDAIIEALRLMGFQANRYRENESEFDIVFEAVEGRFLGEAEGKDNRSINIDKMSQLERNLQEDFARDDIENYAKGVLFGNAFRLSLPADRGDAFTRKCLTAANRSKVALVRTQDLFAPARYLAGHDDSVYAESCRRMFLSTEGNIVKFPEPPPATMTVEEVGNDDSREKELAGCGKSSAGSVVW